MGLLDTVKTQLRPAVAEQASPLDEDHEIEEGLEMSPSRVEVEKPTDVNAATETGVVTIEAAQAVWGKRGRYLIIAGYEYFPFSNGVGPAS